MRKMLKQARQLTIYYQFKSRDKNSNWSWKNAHKYYFAKLDRNLFEDMFKRGAESKLNELQIEMNMA